MISADTTYNVYRQQKKQMFTSVCTLRTLDYKMYKRKGSVDFENIDKNVKYYFFNIYFIILNK